jgi:peptidoglycan hydrolase CwlO-like protein
MKPLFLILAGSNTGAIVLILGILLVASVIGYLTAWFYAKSVYTPVIRSLEADKTELTKQIDGLKNDISNLNEKVDKLNEKISKLENDLAGRNEEITFLKKPKN